MKKNPLFYANTNANKSKKARAWRILSLSLFLLFTISFITIASVRNHEMTAAEFFTCGAAGLGSLAFLPLAAKIKGTMDLNGIDESEADFEARKGAPEDPAKYVARYMAFLEQEIKSLKDNPELKKILTGLKDAMKVANDSSTLVSQLKAEVEKTNLAIEALREKQNAEARQTIETQIKAWAESNKTALESIKTGTKSDLKPINIKVNSPMTPANSLNGSAYLPIPEIDATPNEIVRVQPTFWDVVPKGRSGSATVVWVNKKNPLGAAAFIGPGIAKPGVSFELATETSVAKKVAVSEKIATELLDDIPGMASYIRMELAYQLRAKINTTLMTGVSSATVPAGLQTLSVAYTLTTVQTQAPGNWDCIVAAVAQLRSGNLMGPVTAFINPIDYANMKLWKAQTQGQLFNMIDSGATIIEDNNIPVGFLQVAILPYYVIKIYQDFQVAFGWEDQDFTKNLVTTIAEMRLHQYSSENYAGFAIYDTFANIQAAIAIP